MPNVVNNWVQAFCLLYSLTCTPDGVAQGIIDHLGAPYDGVAWCCLLPWDGWDGKSRWGSEKPHTTLCDRTVRFPEWDWAYGGLLMSEATETVYGHVLRDFCAVWVHKSEPKVS
jgi:hypothetical protein